MKEMCFRIQKRWALVSLILFGFSNVCNGNAVDQHLSIPGHRVVFDRNLRGYPEIHLSENCISSATYAKGALYLAWQKMYPDSNPQEEIPQGLIDILEYAEKTGQWFQIAPQFQEGSASPTVEHLIFVLGAFDQSMSLFFRENAKNVDEGIQKIERQDPVRKMDKALREAKAFEKLETHYEFLKKSLDLIRARKLK